jgi:hypothetical protein
MSFLLFGIDAILQEGKPNWQEEESEKKTEGIKRNK